MQINFTINIDDRIIAGIRNFFSKRNNIVFVFIGIIATTAIVYGAAVTKPWDFNDGDLIDADKINDNFDMLFETVNILQSSNSGFQSGMIMAFIDKNELPDGWFLCDGSTFDTNEYPKLALALGGNTLPDLRGRIVVGNRNMDDNRTSGTATAITDNRNTSVLAWSNVLGAEFNGEVTHRISINELPEHSHTVPDYYTNISLFNKILIRDGGGDELSGVVKTDSGTGSSLPDLNFQDRTTRSYTASNHAITLTPPAVALYYIIKHD
jgi:microcystin-dependent protein